MFSKLFKTTKNEVVRPDKRAAIVLKLINIDRALIEKMAKDNTKKPFDGLTKKEAEEEGLQAFEYIKVKGNNGISFKTGGDLINVVLDKYGNLGQVSPKQTDKLIKILNSEYTIYWETNGGRLLTLNENGNAVYENNDFGINIKLYKN